MPSWLPVRLARVLVCSRAKGRSLASPLATSRTATRLAATWLAFLLNGSPGSAQSVDYAGFEQLFGEPVTTSATGKPQRISEVPANMEIITADDIRRSGADNIPDILQFVAGISVRRYGFAAADVGIRGYNETSNPRLLVLLNASRSTSMTSAARSGTHSRSPSKKFARSRSSKAPTPRCSVSTPFRG
jgi:outer membrane receptor for ferrienterochelin and colicin